MRTYKTINKLSVAFVCAAAAVASFAMQGCVPNYDLDLPLAVNSRNLNVKAEAGNTYVEVFSTGQWSLKFVEEVDWASLSTLQGEGNGSFNFAYAENFGMVRVAKIALASGSLRDTIVITQAGLTPVINIPNPAITTDKTAKELRIPYTTNMKAYLDLMLDSYAWESSEFGWAQVSVTADEIKVTLQENTSGQSRKVTISLGFRDELSEKSYIANFSITQSDQEEKALTFADVRALIPGATGELLIDGIININGIIISDAGNPNMGANPNTGTRAVDITVNGKTAYIQDAAGEYGFRILFDNESDNTFLRYTKAAINIQGATLVKEANPERYTLKSIDPQKITAKAGKPINVPLKEKFISELVDKDVYTFVRLKDIEITNSDGSYSKVNDGYWYGVGNGGINGSNAFFDTFPLSIRGKDGGDMYMLINSRVMWRRLQAADLPAWGDPDARPVPRGSGVLSGIIVHETSLRYGDNDGNIGSYSIRPLTQDEIELDPDRDNSFSKVLVEWNWDYAGAPTKDADGDLTPDIGTGKLRHTLGETIGGGNDFNDPNYTTAASKGVRGNYGIIVTSTKWWNNSTNKGEGYEFTFSTAGLSTSNLYLTYNIGGGSGSAATCFVPIFWEVQYSTDGTNFTKVPGSESIVRPLVWWNNAIPLFTVPGHHDYTVNLPAALIGQNSVTLRIVPSSNIASSDTDIQGHTWDETKNVPIRLGLVSVRYNK